MSKNINRARLYKAKTNKEYKALKWLDDYGYYWDEGISFYPRYRRGYKNSNRQIMSYQVRMYRTWKHNRKTQWKE